MKLHGILQVGYRTAFPGDRRYCCTAFWHPDAGFIEPWGFPALLWVNDQEIPLQDIVFIIYQGKTLWKSEDFK